MNHIGIGRTAEVFRDDDGSAIKLFYDWMPETEAAHEAAILLSVSRACDLAPKYYELVKIEGRSGLRFEFIEGRMAAQQMFKKPMKAWNIARAIGRLHRELHTLHADGLRAAEDVYGPALRSTDWITEGAKAHLLDLLCESSEAALCHGDFHPENILIDEAGRMRVLDWVTAYSGDALSDVARSYYLMRYGRSPNKRSFAQSLLEDTIKPLLARAYLKGYFEKQSFPKNKFKRWLLIIMISRISFEKIPEEEPVLRKAIPRLTKSIR